MRPHWPEYAMEAGGLAVFMLVACSAGTLLSHPASPMVVAIPGELARRALMGLVMGLTAIGLIHSPLGQRSGAHFNPATTLTFWRLGKITGADALAYGLAQTVGGLAGVLLSAVLLGAALGHPSVRYVVTRPRPGGVAEAFMAEAVIAFVLMTVVLHVSNAPRLARFTGLTAGALVAIYITVEAPVSGMSMNPARTLASAAPAGTWDAIWIYFIAPPLGMLLAAEAYVRRRGLAAVYCAKLHHDNSHRCIFRCRYGELRQGA